jgi:tetratricopeptide (TPR) repeat protein
MFVNRIEYDVQDLITDQWSCFNVQRLLPSSFREALVQESGLVAYGVQSPLELPRHLATERWQYLTEHLQAFTQLAPKGQLLVAKLLLSLGFHALVRRLIPLYGPEMIAASQVVTHLALIRAIAGEMLLLDYGPQAASTDFEPREYELVAHNAPPDDFARLAAGWGLVVHAAKVLRDVSMTHLWATWLKQALKTFLTTSTHAAFGQHLMTSRVYRATAMAPYLQGQQMEMVAEMNTAEEHARALLSVAVSEKEILLAIENLLTLLQSRSKEAIALGDLELAEARCREMLSYEQLDPRHFLELGDILVKSGKMEDALPTYRRAAVLGPPATPVAWFMMGQILERLGKHEEAAHCYIETLKVDPGGYVAARRLHNLARALGWSTLANWACERSVETRQ